MATISPKRTPGRCGVAQSLPSLQLAEAAHRSEFNIPSMGGLHASASQVILPRLQGAEKDDRKGLWNQSAAILRAHEEKLPFLRLPMPYREAHLAGENTLMELRHEKMRINAQAQLKGGPSMPPIGGRQRNPLGGAGVAAASSFSHTRNGGATGSSKSSGHQEPHTNRRREEMLLQFHKNRHHGGFVVNRKERQQVALARDRQFVMSEKEKFVEHPDDRHRREQQCDDRWWESIFAPIPRPRDYLPAVFRDGPPLPFPACKPAQQTGNATAKDPSPEFSAEEMSDIVDVCRLFATLTSPPDTLDTSGLALSRPSFCRLIRALGGLSIAPGAPTRLHQAVSHFDELAECIPVKGCSLPGGSVVGFQLNFGTVSTPGLHELGVIYLFARLVRDMASDVPESARRYADQCQEIARNRLFGELLPKAQRYAHDRAEQIRKQIHDSNPSRSTTAAKVAHRTLMVGDDSSSATSATNGGVKRGEEPTSGHASSASDTDVDDRDEENAEGKKLLAHTFAVLKGEILMSQLMEPEVLHFISESRSIFHSLFGAYADTPTPNSEGHMSLTAFLRFADDFALFPSQVDFQTLEWLYNTAESCLDVSPPAPLIDVNVSGGSPGTEIAFSAVGEPRVVEPRGGRKRRAKRQNSDRSPQNRTEESVLWCAKWIRNHLAWLIKEVDDMSEKERRSSAILWAMNDWISYRNLNITDLFTFLAPRKEKHRKNVVISAEVFQKAIKFMQLEDPPSLEEAQQLFALIVPPATQELDMSTLKEVFMIVYTLSDHLERAMNCFLKPVRSMSQAEYSASVFFRELEFILGKNQWTPKDLFRKIDSDGNGRIDSKELEREVKNFVKQQKSPSMAALSIEEPFTLLDLNSDGGITCEEFCLVFAKVREARELKKNSETRHPLFLCATAMMKPNASTHRVFGRRAFVECLLKIAFVHLSFHGTAQQAEQGSLFKALWLMLYLHWQFERAQEQKLAAEKTQGLRKTDNSWQLKRSETKSVPKRRSAKQPTPMQRLLKESSSLFRGAPGAGTSESASPMTIPSSKAGTWGSQVDELLQSCLAELSTSGSNSLDGQLLALVVE